MPIIQSYVGTEHDEEAWLMLCVIAENKPLTSPTFAYDLFLQRIDHFDKVKHQLKIVVSIFS